VILMNIVTLIQADEIAHPYFANALTLAATKRLDMSKIRLTISIALFLSLALSSCSFVFNQSYGLKEIKQVDEKTIYSFANKYGVPLTDCYQLDSTYNMLLDSLHAKGLTESMNNHLQPLQALYYDTSGHLQSFQVNCYAGGYPNLRWTRKNIMTTFPPKKQAPIDSILPLNRHLRFLTPLSKTIGSNQSYGYTVIVYWSRAMGRQSKRFVKTIQRNLLLTDKKIKAIYVNVDNFLATY
ncbi:hypothetical protein, partial [Microcoleus sp. F10-A1]|uniref:hypothetical protein n=1 Tax=Microcoleus sp. F10-A1 TaxID=2818750 RepID=UPI002FD62839